jgi:predicted glycoside hydrolase/deacetylase ChbG (UPF0249 family)
VKLLIVNADDFGINDAANAAIIECHRMGSVTSTTLMANGPALVAAVELGRCNPSLGIGLHFNLTWGEPVSDPAMVSALVDDKGKFLSREVLAKRSLLGRIPREQLEIELDAQFKRLLSLGVDVTHVDSHQHVHALGVVFSTVAALCSRESLPMRVPWVAKERGAGLRRRLRRASLAALLTHSTGRWSGSVRWNDALGSVFDLGVVGGSLETAHYVAILEAAKSGVFELMVHPVTSASAMKGYTRVGAVGEAEYHWLRKGELPSLAESMGFRLGTYRDLP